MTLEKREVKIIKLIGETPIFKYRQETWTFYSKHGKNKIIFLPADPLNWCKIWTFQRFKIRKKTAFDN